MLEKYDSAAICTDMLGRRLLSKVLRLCIILL